MDRRRFLLTSLLCALDTSPAFAEAQEPRDVRRIGYLGNGSRPEVPSELWFNRGLRELGWIEGQTVTIEYRWAEGNTDRLPALAVDLVKAKVDVIVAAGSAGIRAAQRATSTIPIVFVILSDPVALGLVKSYARPGGNTTGVSSEFEELITKQLQLLTEVMPNVRRVALLGYDHPEVPTNTLAWPNLRTPSGRHGACVRWQSR